jgi:LmbE family N-acetylglucosaminyl deacetylase
VRWDGPGPGERLLVLAPHPDDETLAAGGLLQRALARGGAARVLFATDGENNPWTQRLVERRVRIGPEDSARFGRRRRGEALAALVELGLRAEDAVFLGLPDQAITDLLLFGDQIGVNRLASLLADWRPTLVILPSPFDLHPDHSALAVLARLALSRVSPGRSAGEEGARILTYIVHRTAAMRPDEGAEEGPDVARFELSPAEKARKRRAILCHATQLTVHRRKFLAYAQRPEVFLVDAARGVPGNGLHPVRRAIRDGSALRLDLKLRPRPGAFGRPTLHVAAGAEGARQSLSLDLRWRRGRSDITDALTMESRGLASLRGGRRGGIVEVPLASLPRSGRLFVKLKRRFGFFDEGGWLEVDGLPDED